MSHTPTSITKAHSTSSSKSAATPLLPTTTTSTPIPTPSLVIPPQCEECYGVNNTSGMTCFKNTQCVPLQYLCENSSSSSSTSGSNTCTDIDGDQDPDDPILCQDQLCAPVNFLPIPSPGIGKMIRSSSSSDDCLLGSYYSLFGTTPKYTQSCVEPYTSSNVDCEAWEYLAQSSCFLSTCGPGMDCQPPFVCQKLDSSELYGICTNPNGTTSGWGGSYPNAADDGGAATRYSSREYLIQGLLIGICCLALGVGLGVGFWHYKRKRFTARWTRSSDEQGSSSSNNYSHGIRSTGIHTRDRGAQADKGSHWLSTLLSCGNNSRRRDSNARAQTRGFGISRAAINPDRDFLSQQHTIGREPHRDSLAESDRGDEGSIMSRGHRQRWSGPLFAGRWRWGTGSDGQMISRAMTPGGMTIFPEMEPPPMYHNGPDLPTYGDSTEAIVLNTMQNMPSSQQQQQQQPTGPHSVGSISSPDDYASITGDALPEMPPLALVSSSLSSPETRISGLIRDMATPHFASSPLPSNLDSSSRRLSLSPTSESETIPQKTEKAELHP
ncbi:hypothetical protein EDD11_005266 [Mortierella claussenii]|nr:hypothetical protein EDD11_005266 [Mortierella claussenii]